VAEALLSTQGLTKRFGNSTAVDDISLAVETGMIHAIVGTPNSGKSTLAGLLAGTIFPDRGTIRLNGRAIERKPARERVRMGIALFAGSAAAFPEESVLDNVRIVREASRRKAGSILGGGGEATEVAAWRALAVTNLKKHAHLRASGLEFMDRRWLEIAQVLVCEPQVIVFDELFAGASPGDVQELCELLLGLKGKHAIILNDRSVERVLPFASRISMLAYGRVIATGAPEEISTRRIAAGGVGSA
jgi:branched-chain amino acid transport system ATP-binding protein